MLPDLDARPNAVTILAISHDRREPPAMPGSPHAVPGSKRLIF
jgi:hypothetical protein